MFGLFVALLTSAVVPVDVFLVSYMKNSNGTFKVRAWIIHIFKLTIEKTTINTLAAQFRQMILCMQTSKYCVIMLEASFWELSELNGKSNYRDFGQIRRLK